MTLETMCVHQQLVLFNIRYGNNVLWKNNYSNNKHDCVMSIGVTNANKTLVPKIDEKKYGSRMYWVQFHFQGICVS